MLELIKTVKDKVDRLLEKYPQTRDCDKTLYMAFLWTYTNMREFDGDFASFAKRVTWSDVPCPESISRARRLIQASGRYQGERRKERLESETEVRANIGAL